MATADQSTHGLLWRILGQTPLARPLVLRGARACAALFVLSLAGCPSASAPTNAPTLPLAGKTVEIVTPDELHAPAAWEALLQEWSAQTGAAVSHVALPPQPIAEAATAGGRLYVLPLDQFPRWADAGRLTGIPTGPLSGYDAQDMFSGLKNSLSWRRQNMLVPVAAPVLVCCYRRDLLAAAGLEPPQTWADYESLIDRLATWAPGLTAVEPWSIDNRAETWAAHLLSVLKQPENYSVWFDIETGEPRWTQPDVVAGLDDVARRFAKLSSASRTLSVSQVWTEFVQGRAALGLVALPWREAAIPRDEAESLGFCRLPGRALETRGKPSRGAAVVHAPALLPYWGWGVGFEKAEVETLEGSAALALLQEVTSLQLEQTFPGALKTPCRASQESVAPGWWGDWLSGTEADSYTAAVLATLKDEQSTGLLPIPSRDEFLQDIRKVLSTWNEPPRPAPDIANELQTAWKQRLEQLGQNRIRDEYRQALGLTPLR